MPELRFDLKSVVMIVGWVLTASGLYYGLTGQIQTQGERLSAQTTTIQSLSDRVKTSEELGRAQERAIIELTVTLRARNLLK